MTFINDVIYKTLHRENKNMFKKMFLLQNIMIIHILDNQNKRCELINPNPIVDNDRFEFFNAL